MKLTAKYRIPDDDAGEDMYAVSSTPAKDREEAYR
jgi:hypothetical protein